MAHYSIDRTIIYLFGYPGIGKATIAHEIAGASNAIQIDNHKVSNLLRDIAGDKAPHLLEPIKKTGAVLSKVLLDFMADHCRDQSYVLTSVLYQNDPFRRQWFDDFMAWADQHGWRLIPVQLICDLDVAKQRLQNDQRRGQHKLMNPQILESLYQDHELLTPHHPNLLTLNITDLTAPQAAEQVLIQATA